MNRPFIDAHEVFETPVLVGIPDITLQLEPQTILGKQKRIAQCHITAEQHHMSRLVRVQMRFHEHHNVEQIGKRLMPESHLVDGGLDPVLDRRGL